MNFSGERHSAQHEQAIDVRWLRNNFTHFVAYKIKHACIAVKVLILNLLLNTQFPQGTGGCFQGYIIPGVSCPREVRGTLYKLVKFVAVD